MANQYAVNHKKRHVTKPAKLTDVATQGGRVRVLHDTFVTASTADQTEILFGKLPPGAKIWEAQLHTSSTLANNATMSMGTTESATAFLGVLAAQTADQSRWMSGGATTATNKIGVGGIAPVSVTV